MKETDRLGRENLREARAGIRTRAGLLICFLLGALLAAAGLQGQRELTGSGFGSESAYQAIYALSGDAEGIVRILRADLDSLPESARLGAERAAREALSAGGLADADTLEIGTVWKYLAVYEAMNGPKIGAGERKTLTGLSASAGEAFRRQALQCLSDETLPLPAETAETLSPLEGAARREMLLQQILTSAASENASYTDHINQLKKSVRGKDLQGQAFRMIAAGSLNGLWQTVIGNSRTVILLGILVMLDAAVLFLLMRADRNWRMNVKWVMILGIADFLLVFQVVPVVYMVIRALFPEGGFSLSTLERLFTYSLNLEALKNTLIASFATMILGTAIAFPLAWLVGRTNLYGKKFFRALFVMTYMVPPYVGAMAWLRLMNPNVGTVNLWLRMLFRLPDAPGPLNVYTLPGMIWVLTTFYYPYAFITVSRAMEKIYSGC